ncbi:photosynthetic complex putative assembly protein PuhB [Jiella sonneratiae]|uniref:PH domain-containing protein n=1 Tax=Jiella sonneratiae TaxID=2816856 RepID=A0ABS3J6X8_9HYPH|nr:photosynthetic complex putative assembly protein PuhB [Jiella sonneratiae]MBO0905402.1 PH domain-containing protein [Jiella sonneratiae]
MSAVMEEFDDIKPVVDAGELPAGETILWQGRPDWWRLAVGAFRLKLVGAWFLAFALWKVGATHHDTGSWATGLADAATLLPALGVGVGLIMLLSFLTARATSFTLTSRRIVMRYGVALPAQLNIPLAEIDHAAVKIHADGTGDLPLKLPKKGRPSYFQLWPYARPWKLGAAEPMLRAVPRAAEVARLVGDALVASQGGKRAALPATTTPAKAGFGAATPAAV